MCESSVNQRPFGREPRSGDFPVAEPERLESRLSAARFTKSQYPEAEDTSRPERKMSLFTLAATTFVVSEL